jgi:hypothetical protein
MYAKHVFEEPRKPGTPLFVLRLSPSGFRPLPPRGLLSRKLPAAGERPLVFLFILREARKESNRIWKT